LQASFSIYRNHLYLRRTSERTYVVKSLTPRELVAGGKGKDRFDGGKGNDTITTRDRRRETVRRGKGTRDRVTADRIDRLIGCEKVRRR
jgi:hypothetical protein